MNLEQYDPTEDHVRNELRAGALDLSLHGRGPQVAMRRARGRRRRRQAGTAVLTAGAVTAGAVGVVRLSRAGAPVSSGGEATSTTAAPLPPLALTWSRHDDGLGDTFVDYSADPAGGIYALSTAPGFSDLQTETGRSPKAVYKVGDDGNWSATPSTPNPGTPAFGQLVADGGLLYAAGTAPGTAAGGMSPSVANSADGGRTWTAKPLPVPPPREPGPWITRSTVTVGHVNGVVVAVQMTSYSLRNDQLKAMAPSPELGAKATGMRVTDQGIDALSVPPGFLELNHPRGSIPDDPVLYTIPWDRLGVSGPEAIRAAVSVFIRQGDDWSPVEAPELQGMHGAELATIGDELVLRPVLGMPIQESDRRVLASKDGRSWRVVPDAALGQLAAVGSTWVNLGYGLGFTGLRTSTDQGATWTEHDLAQIDPRLADTQVAYAGDGPLGLVFGARTMRKVAERGASLPPPFTAVEYLVTTRDLRTFSVTPMSELIDGAAFATAAVVGNDRIILTGMRPAPTSGPPRPQESFTLVGTPTR